MEYTITEVKFFSEDVYGKDKNHRVVVHLEGEGAVEGKDYSAFVQERPSAGDKWVGEIKKAEKNDKIYWNFEFPKGTTFKKAGGDYQPAPDALRVERKIDTIITEVQMMRGVLGEILQKVKPITDEPF